MTGQIPQSFIENLLARTDIVELISGRVTLRRAGANYVARCPFHTEKTPSFSVSPSKQFYHCFGCGASGDAIRFLTEFEGLHFVEAVESLASRAGLSVPVENSSGEFNTKTSYTAVYAILSEAEAFYQKCLAQHREATKVHNYLKGRGLTGRSAKQFCLGFAPPEWDALVKHLGTNSTRLEELVLAGLAVKKEKGGFYDRFRDRVLFPIRDRRGRVIGFGGRIIGSEGEPKYLNSPETPVFNKGNELYGLYEARLGNRSLSNFIVVEGYMDVVMLAQAGIKNVVATLGTAFTEKQVDVLFRQVSELIFCFDGDKAGKTAAKRALPLILPHMKEGRRVRFMLLPEGEDPDSFVRKMGSAAFLDRVERAMPLSDFLFDQLSAQLDLQHLDGRAQLITVAKPLLKLVPAGVLQQMLYERLAELAGVNVEMIQGTGNKRKNLVSNKSFIKSTPLPPTAAYRAVAMLLKHRFLLKGIGSIQEFQKADTPGTVLLCAIIGILSADPTISTEAIPNRLPEDCVSQFSLDALQAIVGSIPEEGIEQEFLGALQRLRERTQEQNLEFLLKKAKTAALSLEEKAHLKDLLDQKQKTWVD
jgi:DNA primase